VYGSSAPLATNDVLDLGGGWNVGGDNTLGSGSYGMGISIADASGIPGGTWVLRKNGADFALFDFTSLAPYDEEGHFLYFIPSIQASVEADGRLTRLDLRWYAYDKVTGDYALVPDLQQLDEWLHYYGFGIGHTDNTVFPPTSIEEISSNTTSITDFRNQWYFDSPPSSGVAVSGVWVLYSIGSMSFSFNYNRDFF